MSLSGVLCSRYTFYVSLLLVPATNTRPEQFCESNAKVSSQDPAPARRGKALVASGDNMEHVLMPCIHPGGSGAEAGAVKVAARGLQTLRCAEMNF